MNKSKIIWLVLSLIPMPFLFHFFETSNIPNIAPFLFLGTLIFVISAGIFSTKIKFHNIIIINIISILISVSLAKQFINPPNGAWFNPFGMNFAIIFTGIVILIGLLIIRFISKIILNLKDY